MSLFEVPRLFLAAVAAYLLLLGPGHAWWRGRTSALPPWFARVALSVSWTSVLATTLTAAGQFSLALVVLINGALTLLGYLQSGRVRIEGVAPPASPHRFGMVVALLALLLYWPPYETFFGAADSSVYLAAGVHVAKTGGLAVVDELGPKVPPGVAINVFRPLEWNASGSLYRRTNGGLATEGLGAPVAWPAFFPLPAVWGAMVASALGPARTPAYATLFAAMAMWAFWLFARARLPPLLALGATALAALNGVTYWFAHFALSEPIAMFFVWAGLVALDAWEEEGFAADARLAGLLFGAAAFTRVEFVLYLGGALLLVGLLPAPLTRRRLPLGFHAALLAMLAATAMEAQLIPGTYTTPVGDAARRLVWYLGVFHARMGPLAWVTAAAGVAIVVWLARRLGPWRMLRIVTFCGLLGGYFIASRFVPGRSLVWLSLYLGWPLLVLSAAGCWIAWRQRHAQPSNAFFVALTAVSAAILIYNPQVATFLPWAMRRYMPLLIPALVVLGGVAVASVARRSLLAAALAFSLIVWGIAPGGKTVWGRAFFEGNAAQLDELAQLLPMEGTLLISTQLYAYMLESGLWLLYGHDNLPVHPDSTPAGRFEIAMLVARLRDEGPVYLLARTLTRMSDIPRVKKTLVASYSLSQRLPESTQLRLPEDVQLYVTPVSLYRLDWVPVTAPPPASEAP